MKRVVSEVPPATSLLPRDRRGTSDTTYWTKPRASPRLWGFNRAPSPGRGARRKVIAAFGCRWAGKGDARDARLGSSASIPGVPDERPGSRDGESRSTLRMGGLGD